MKSVVLPFSIANKTAAEAELARIGADAVPSTPPKIRPLSAVEELANIGSRVLSDVGDRLVHHT